MIFREFSRAQNVLKRQRNEIYLVTSIALVLNFNVKDKCLITMINIEIIEKGNWQSIEKKTKLRLILSVKDLFLPNL